MEVVKDTSFYDTAIYLWGTNLERGSRNYKKDLLCELEELVRTGGCFEDEDFISVQCADGDFTIKPIIWFRSRSEANELIKLCQQ